jgi:hypothetical protein
MSIRTCVLALVAVFALATVALAPSSGAAFATGAFHPKEVHHLPKDMRRLPR